MPTSSLTATKNLPNLLQPAQSLQPCQQISSKSVQIRISTNTRNSQDRIKQGQGILTQIICPGNAVSCPCFVKSIQKKAAGNCKLVSALFQSNRKFLFLYSQQVRMPRPTMPCSSLYHWTADCMHACIGNSRVG